MAGELTHLDEASHPRMVDVGEKAVTARSATAEAWVAAQKKATCSWSPSWREFRAPSAPPT